MPPLTHRAPSVIQFNSAKEKRLRELEEMRLHLPTHLYLQILHTAAITGTLPEYDYRPFSGDPPKLREGADVILQAQDRLKILTYLVDKALAPLAASKSAEPEQMPNISALPPDTRALTLNQLLSMVKATATDVDHTPAQAPHDPNT